MGNLPRSSHTYYIKVLHGLLQLKGQVPIMEEDIIVNKNDSGLSVDLINSAVVKLRQSHSTSATVFSQQK